MRWSWPCECATLATIIEIEAIKFRDAYSVDANAGARATKLVGIVGRANILGKIHENVLFFFKLMISLSLLINQCESAK